MARHGIPPGSNGETRRCARRPSMCPREGRVRPSLVVDPHLGDGDPVQGKVELTVAGPAGTVFRDVARPDRMAVKSAGLCVE